MAKDYLNESSKYSYPLVPRGVRCEDREEIGW